MYVCICNAVREADIHAAVAGGGCRKVRDLRTQLGVAAECGRCAGCAREVLHQALQTRASNNPAVRACCAAA
ncbi:MAG: (2Fe-2S)-binding protein [Rhodocyclaceae bacterium]|jgi:bacterioferritin-associated ferredoxin|nr:(2Fe-2S)-binding protein [Rhodocyclaceae bacterium]MBK6908988.1 (2Fe-2S)-binding protein [Rhodocyclaceae bacterium]